MKILKWLWFQLMYRKYSGWLWLAVSLNICGVKLNSLEWWVIYMPTGLFFTWTDYWGSKENADKIRKI